MVKSVKVTEVFRVGRVSDLDHLTDAVLTHLMSLEDGSLFDADVSAELATGLVEVSVLSVAQEFDLAVERGSAAIHEAMLEAGGYRNSPSSAVSFHTQARRSDLVVPV